MESNEDFAARRPSLDRIARQRKFEPDVETVEMKMAWPGLRFERITVNDKLNEGDSPKTKADESLSTVFLVAFDLLKATETFTPFPKYQVSAPQEQSSVEVSANDQESED
jgi:hypothetical protein